MAFTRPTVFILGAGASFEFGMPLGGKLKEDVGRALDIRFEGGQQVSGDYELYGLLQHKFAGSAPEYAKFGRRLAEVMPTFVSIDEALHYFSSVPEAVMLGKVEIVRQILRREKGSALATDAEIGKPRIDRADGTWAAHLFSMVMGGVRREEAKAAFEKITFINFNYDRTLEHYMFWMLLERAGFSVEEAIYLAGNQRIIRPYGHVGNLDWQMVPGPAFGGSANADPFQLADSIRTYTEEQSSDIAEQIKQCLTDAELIVILGFGFHSQNMKLIMPASMARPPRNRNVFGTVLGIDAYNHSFLAGEIQRYLTGLPPTLASWECKRLMGELRLSLLS